MVLYEKEYKSLTALKLLYDDDSEPDDQNLSA